MTDKEKLINVFEEVGVPIEINTATKETRIEISENEKTVYYDTVGIIFVFDENETLKRIEMVS